MSTGAACEPLLQAAMDELTALSAGRRPWGPSSQAVMVRALVAAEAEIVALRERLAGMGGVA